MSSLVSISMHRKEWSWTGCPCGLPIHERWARVLRLTARAARPATRRFYGKRPCVAHGDDVPAAASSPVHFFSLPNESAVREPDRASVPRSDYGTHCEMSTVSVAVLVPSLTVIVVWLPPEAPLVPLTVNVPGGLVGITVATAVLLLTAVKVTLKPASVAVKFSGTPAPPLHAVPGGRTATVVGLSTIALPDGLGDGLGDVDGETPGLGEVEGDALGAGIEATMLGLGCDGLCADCGVSATSPPLHAAMVIARTAIAGKTTDLTDLKEGIVFPLSECRKRLFESSVRSRSMQKYGGKPYSITGRPRARSQALNPTRLRR